MRGSFTIEKSIVSSAKNLILDLMFFSGSLIKNNKGPSIEPCGTPDSMLDSSEKDPFKTTCYFLLLK